MEATIGPSPTTIDKKNRILIIEYIAYIYIWSNGGFVTRVKDGNVSVHMIVFTMIVYCPISHSLPFSSYDEIQLNTVGGLGVKCDYLEQSQSSHTLTFIDSSLLMCATLVGDEQSGQC